MKRINFLKCLAIILSRAIKLVSGQVHEYAEQLAEKFDGNHDRLYARMLNQCVIYMLGHDVSLAHGSHE